VMEAPKLGWGPAGSRRGGREGGRIKGREIKKRGCKERLRREKREGREICIG